jgi:pimeloyl-ACP methyl ester carboxylesterase
MAQASPAPDGAVNQMVQAPGGRLHISDHPGQDPALVLHGFPDDSRVYDRLVPLLAPRRVIALDWHGYGRSDPLAGLFRHADLHLVQGASHWPQWDQPELVARLITQAAASDPGALLP